VLKVNASHKLWNIPEGKKVVMEYTGAWQPVGKSGSKFRRMTGKIVRSGAFLRISDSWKKVPQTTKEDLWNSLMVCVN
jgi:hypothetical protein